MTINWKWVLVSALSLFVYIKGTSSLSNYKEAVAKKASELKQLALGMQAAEMERSLAVAALEQSEANEAKLRALLLDSQLERKKIAADAAVKIAKVQSILQDSENLADASVERSQEVAKLATDSLNELFMEMQIEIND